MDRLRGDGEAARDGVRSLRDRIVVLGLSEVAVDCCTTKAPCGGESVGGNAVDRGNGASNIPQSWTVTVSRSGRWSPPRE
jgi:hypothetical protein